MKIEESKFKGVHLFRNETFFDHRGSFTKSFNNSNFKSYNIDFRVKESFNSFSKKNVLRGFHFQVPPYDHSKVVTCVFGEILDVIIDLRKSSDTYLKVFNIKLGLENDYCSIYIPPGFAHAFKVLSDFASTSYLTSCEYKQDSDLGILFNSIDFDWGSDLIVSERDLSFPKLDSFKTPFI